MLPEVTTPAPASPPLLEVDRLRVHYLGADPVCAVDGVSFTVGRGEVVGLVGESGCGKSTVAQAIVRILQPPGTITGGAVRFEGRDILDMDGDELRAFRWRKVAVVMQSAASALNPVMTVGVQIADAIEAHEKIKRRTALERAAELLDRVGVGAARIGAYPHQLSGGMRQRVGIAMALALEPALLILDEPTTALDVVVQHDILAELDELRRRQGFAMLFISHDLNLMLQLATRIAVLYAGEVIEEASAAELLRAPRHPYTQGLLRSVPSLTGPRQALGSIPGSPPDLRAPPAGCRFHPRCDQVLTPCHDTVPPRRLARGHQVACHLDGPGGS